MLYSSYSKTKYVLFKICAIASIVVLLFSSIAIQEVNADTQGSVKPAGIVRLAGNNRYGTSNLVSDEYMKEHPEDGKLDYIILTTGSSFKDSLSGSFLASQAKTHMLLINDNSDKKKVVSQIKKVLKPEGTIYILGGSKAVPTSIQNELKEKKIAKKIKRLKGATGYETNLEILKEGFGLIENKTDLIVCTGENYPDGLSAAATGLPIMLVAKKITADQKAFLRSNKKSINKIWVIGGDKAVSETVYKQLGNYGVTERVFGNDRYQTSIKVAGKFFRMKKINEVVIARGNNFPDALVAGPLANAKGCPLILCDNTDYRSFGPAYKSLLTKSNINRATILAGTDFIANDAIGLTTKGAKKPGLLTVGGRKYFGYEDGSLSKNETKTVKDKTYIFGSDRVGRTNGIIKDGNKYVYIKNGKKDNTVCMAAKQDGVEWNVINGIATKVVTQHDKTLNRALKLIAQVTDESMTKKQKLRACFNHIRDNYPEYNPRIPHYTGTDWPIVYANDIFVGVARRGGNKGGNCLSVAAAFAYMAKGLGYENVYGCNSGGHGWAEIDGLVYDPEWTRHSPGNYFGISYYAGYGPDYRMIKTMRASYARVKI